MYGLDHARRLEPQCTKACGNSGIQKTDRARQLDEPRQKKTVPGDPPGWTEEGALHALTIMALWLSLYLPLSRCLSLSLPLTLYLPLSRALSLSLAVSSSLSRFRALSMQGVYVMSGRILSSTDNPRTHRENSAPRRSLHKRLLFSPEAGPSRYGPHRRVGRSVNCFIASEILTTSPWQMRQEDRY